MNKKNVRLDFEKRQYVVHTMIMRMTEKESLRYLASKGYEMTPRHYYRLKKEIKEFSIEKLVEIGGRESMINGFVEQHLERIKNLELVNENLWREFHLCETRKDRRETLMYIAELQPYISAYYSATQEVFDRQIREFESKKRLELNPHRTKYDNHPLNKLNRHETDDSIRDSSNSMS